MGIRKNIHSQVNTNIKWNSVQKEFKKLMELHTNMELLRKYIISVYTTCPQVLYHTTISDDFKPMCIYKCFTILYFVKYT